MEQRLIQSAARNPVRLYGVAVGCAAGALLIRLPLASVLQDKVPYITFFLATAVSATYGGLGPGLVTTFLGALLAGLYIIPLAGSLAFASWADVLGLFIFLGVSGFISYLAEQRLDAMRHENALRILFEQTFLSIGDAIIATDDSKRIRLMNPVAETLTGWSAEEARGRSIEEVFRIVQENSSTPAEVPIDRILKTGEIVGLANHTELLTKAGDRISIDDSGAPIRAPNGEVVGAVLVFRDISERRRTEIALEAANDELKQFTYAATHDIREPLRVIAIFSQLIARNLAGKADAQTIDYAARVHDAAQRLSHLLDGLLQFTGMRDAADDLLQPSPVDAGGALAEAIRDLDAALHDANGTITHDPLPNVQGNFVHLCQLLQNLIGNALKYARPGVPPVVHVSAARDDAHWTFAIRDNGIGIAPEHHAEIFIPFKRFHGPEIRGAGIGLAICKRIVERYGGRIWVTANNGPGSTFYFTMPATEKRIATQR